MEALVWWYEETLDAGATMHTTLVTEYACNTQIKQGTFILAVLTQIGLSFTSHHRLGGSMHFVVCICEHPLAFHLNTRPTDSTMENRNARKVQTNKKWCCGSTYATFCNSGKQNNPRMEGGCLIGLRHTE